jgi:hypothetical protein
MKSRFFKRLFFCLLAISVCVIGSASVELQNLTAFEPPGWSEMIDVYAPVLAMGALVIPAYDMEKLTCVKKEVFESLQAKFGRLYVIDVSVDESENYQFLLRRPTRQHLEIIESYKGDVTKTNDFMIKNLVVAGNENNQLDDGVVYAQLMGEAAKIIQQGQSFLGKA